MLLLLLLMVPLLMVPLLQQHTIDEAACGNFPQSTKLCACVCVCVCTALFLNRQAWVQHPLHNEQNWVRHFSANDKSGCGPRSAIGKDGCGPFAQSTSVGAASLLQLPRLGVALPSTIEKCGCDTLNVPSQLVWHHFFGSSIWKLFFHRNWTTLFSWLRNPHELKKRQR